MTINILTAVQDDGLVMCADSMLTLTGVHPFTQGPVETTFENAEKLIELSSSQPAAAMVSGAADIRGKLVSSFLRDASRTIDNNPLSHTTQGIVDVVFATIDTAFEDLITAVRGDTAALLSQTDQLGEINQRRAQNSQPPLTEILPGQIAIRGEKTPPADPVYVVELTALTVVVCSYYDGEPSAVELVWPGGRRRVCFPGEPLWWWGSGGSAVARLVRGFDFDLLQSHSAAGVPESPKAQEMLDYAERWKDAYNMPTPVGSMPLQDAVEFTEYLGNVA